MRGLFVIGQRCLVTSHDSSRADVFDILFICSEVLVCHLSGNVPSELLVFQTFVLSGDSEYNIINVVCCVGRVEIQIEI